jgi:hypothetical protein
LSHNTPAEQPQSWLNRGASAQLLITTASLLSQQLSGRNAFLLLALCEAWNEAIEE